MPITQKQIDKNLRYFSATERGKTIFEKSVGFILYCIINIGIGIGLGWLYG